MEIENKYPNEFISRNVLYTIVKSFKPKRYLEIGVSEGGSLRVVLENTELEFLAACDTWGRTYGGTGRGNHNHIIRLLTEFDYKGKVDFLDGDSRILIPQYKPESLFDLILVDGDHSYNGAWYDLNNSWKLLESGGYIIIDDLIHPQHKYLTELIENWANETGASLVYKNLETKMGVAVYQK